MGFFNFKNPRHHGQDHAVHPVPDGGLFRHHHRLHRRHGSGGAIGYGVGNISSDPDAQGTFAVWGAVAGFGIVSAAVFWVREYILYIVKAGHIAVMVELLQGKDLPMGRGQIEHAKAVVTERFIETNVLFAADQLIKGIIRAITGLLGGIAAILPIPGLDGLVRFINSVIRMSLTFVDEIILGYAIKTNSDNPWASARTGIILYAQNGKVMVKKRHLADHLHVDHLDRRLPFVHRASRGYSLLLPGQAGGWGFVVAIVFCLGFQGGAA